MFAPRGKSHSAFPRGGMKMLTLVTPESPTDELAEQRLSGCQHRLKA